MKISIALAGLAGLFLATPSLSNAQIACGANVDLSPSGTEIAIQPSGGDDTANIQCALDAAVANDITLVKLDPGVFSISSLEIENFSGTLEGRTRATTIVQIEPLAIDCEAMENSGQISSVIRFVRGRPTLQFMRIEANLGPACTSGNPARVLVHFSGRRTGTAECDSDVIFGAVDRVDMIGGGNANRASLLSLAAAPEGIFFGDDCKDTLLGTFKANRSSFDGFLTGVFTSIRGAGQVDINFNEFSGNSFAVGSQSANQSTTIIGNDIHVAAGFGIVTEAFPDSPAVTRLAIENNRFFLAAQDSNSAVSGIVSTSEFGDSQDVNLTVRGNQFEMNSARFIVANSYSAATVGGPLFSRPSINCTGGPGGDFNFHVRAFRVATSGTYTIDSTQDYDGFIHVYSNGFNPAAPLANCIVGDDFTQVGDSQLTTALQPGVDYFLVTSSFAPGQTGTFTNTITGPGEIQLEGEGAGGLIQAVRLISTSNASIAANTFTGDGLGVSIQNGLLQATDNVVAGNSFIGTSPFFDLGDINLGAGTSGNIIGGGQAAIVVNDDPSNTILDAGLQLQKQTLDALGRPPAAQASSGLSASGQHRLD